MVLVTSFFHFQALFQCQVLALEKLILGVVHDHILVFGNHVEGVENVDGVVNSPLYVFEDCLVGLLRPIVIW